MSRHLINSMFHSSSPSQIVMNLDSISVRFFITFTVGTDFKKKKLSNLHLIGVDTKNSYKYKISNTISPENLKYTALKCLF